MPEVDRILKCNQVDAVEIPGSWERLSGDSGMRVSSSMRHLQVTGFQWCLRIRRC
jgi:hypothetical protein